MARDEQQSSAQQWRNGISLSEAWFAFGDSRSGKLFREAQGHGGREARLILMVVDLWARLSSGELLAFGHRVSPTISDGPVLIPTDTFFDRPPPGIGTGDDIEMSGWRYERVKVCERESVTDAGELEANAGLKAGGINAAEPVGGSLAAKRGGGRPSVYNKAAIVLRELFKVTPNVTLSADRLHSAFEAQFAERFPASAYGITPPSVRSLRNYLALYRQELAETGNNKPAG